MVGFLFRSPRGALRSAPLRGGAGFQGAFAVKHPLVVVRGRNPAIILYLLLMVKNKILQISADLFSLLVIVIK